MDYKYIGLMDAYVFVDCIIPTVLYASAVGALACLWSQSPTSTIPRIRTLSIGSYIGKQLQSPVASVLDQGNLTLSLQQCDPNHGLLPTYLLRGPAVIHGSVSLSVIGKDARGCIHS